MAWGHNILKNTKVKHFWTEKLELYKTEKTAPLQKLNSPQNYSWESHLIFRTDPLLTKIQKASFNRVSLIKTQNTN